MASDGVRCVKLGSCLRRDGSPRRHLWYSVQIMTMDRLHRMARQHVLTDRLLGLATLPIPMMQPPAATTISRTTAAPAVDRGSHAPAVRAPVDSTPTRRTSVAPAAPAVKADSGAPVTRTQASQTGNIALPPVQSADTSPAASHSAQERLQLLQHLDESQVRGCEKCVLCEKRIQTVFGEGNPHAQLMFIGEGPGEQEDKQGRPFVGPAGQLLDKMITAMGLSRDEVYITNAVKCRPPENRPPLPDETQACSAYLKQQIGIVRPRVIVTLGAPATKLMLNTTMGISGIRGRWHEYPFTDDQGHVLHIPIMPTFHPSYVLRRYTAEVRKTVWDDLQAVMAYLKQIDQG